MTADELDGDADDLIERMDAAAKTLQNFGLDSVLIVGTRYIAGSSYVLATTTGNYYACEGSARAWLRGETKKTSEEDRG